MLAHLVLPNSLLPNFTVQADFCAPLHPFHRLGLPDRLEAWRAQFASLDLGTYEEARDRFMDRYRQAGRQAGRRAGGQAGRWASSVAPMGRHTPVPRGAP